MNNKELHAALREFYNRDESYFRTAGEANATMTPERRKLFEFIPQGALLLDVGSGGCENAEFLRGKARYVASDLSHLALRRAADQGRPLLGGVQSESQSLPFREGAFDVVLSTYALEHFVYPEKSLAEMWRVCRKGGRLILISPAYDNPFSLPPSVSKWNALQRAALVVGQCVRQCRRHFIPNRLDFAQIRRPRALAGEYESDFDLVHLVSAREVGNMLKMLGGKILFERKREVRPGGGLRNLLLRAGIGEYAGLNLQLVVEKP